MTHPEELNGEALSTETLQQEARRTNDGAEQLMTPEVCSRMGEVFRRYYQACEQEPVDGDGASAPVLRHD